MWHVVLHVKPSTWNRVQVERWVVGWLNGWLAGWLWGCMSGLNKASEWGWIVDYYYGFHLHSGQMLQNKHGESSQAVCASVLQSIQTVSPTHLSPPGLDIALILHDGTFHCGMDELPANNRTTHPLQQHPADLMPVLLSPPLSRVGYEMGRLSDSLDKAGGSVTVYIKLGQELYGRVDPEEVLPRGGSVVAWSGGACRVREVESQTTKTEQ